jgi:hypothetical protein
MRYGRFTGQTFPIVGWFEEEHSTIYVIDTPLGAIEYYEGEIEKVS